jgi:hypothetical protein
MKFLLPAVLLCITVTATAQRVPALQQRLRALELTAVQKHRIMVLIRKERMQNYLNQKELNQILTPKQKDLLLKWRKEKDSVRKF